MRLGSDRRREHGVRARARHRRARRSCTTSTQAKASALAEELGGEAVGSNAELAERADVLVLCHKPKQLDEVAARGRTAARRWSSRSWPRPPPSRSPPPTRAPRSTASSRTCPPRCGAGCSATSPGPGAADGPEDEILALMGRAGAVIPLDDEPLIEPAMALMSCGPAFMALVAESFADAGAAHGLDPDDAHADGRRDDGRHGGLPRAARLRRARDCARGWPRPAAPPSRA